MNELFETKWEEKLLPNEIVDADQKGRPIKLVVLKGLQRLAREAGIIGQTCSIMTPSDRLVQAIVTVTFQTNRGPVTFSGAADCGPKNTSPEYANYPTAVAESRAEGRALRKALGIEMLSLDEINLVGLEFSPGKKADKQLIVAIQALCERKSIEPARVFSEALADKERAASIFELESLTTEEAQSILQWLNNYVPKQSAAVQREARKAALQEKLQE